MGDSFECRETWNPERIHALAIYCSDGRWGNAFDEFCHEVLSIPRYDRFAVPGGPVWLNMLRPGGLRRYDAARDHLDFLVRVHQVERAVLIGHYGCAFYSDMLGMTIEDAVLEQQADLRIAAGNLRGWFAGIQVEAYMALREEWRISFTPVPVGG